jgi:hypothetical protein
MTEIDPLLAAVEALTKPKHTRAVQDVIERWTSTDADGVEHEHEKVIGTQSVTITHLPLLDQFRAAVIPSSNTAAGSSSLASTRNALDATALFEYAKISAATADWCRIIHVEATRDASWNLQRWHAAFRALASEPNVTIWYIHQLRSWAGLIRAHLDPPRRRNIMYPCPICGKTTWSTGDGEGGTWPLELLYRIGDDDEPVIESVICRACEPVTTWPTRDAVAELIAELEERHAS